MPLNDVAILYKNHHVYALKYYPALALFPLRALLQLLQEPRLPLTVSSSFYALSLSSTST